MSYCCFEDFMFLTKVYLDVNDHHLFDNIKELLREVNISPTDVVENLTPKAPGEDTDTCLAALMEVLEKDKAEEPVKKKGKEKEKEAADDEVDNDKEYE
jgi:hypothetical protein